MQDQALESPRVIPGSGHASDLQFAAGARCVRDDGTRIVGLDGLRGIAALGVLLFHFTTCYQGYFSFNGPLPFSFEYGFFGVQLFFLISGFVIFMTVERATRPIDFARSRFMRLYPAFWLSLLVCSLLLGFTEGPGPPLGWGRLARRIVVNATMVPGWFHVAELCKAYWTLAIEMTFYVIVLVLLAIKRLDWTVPVLSGFVVLGAIDGIYASSRPNPISPWLRSWLALDYLHVILIGVILYKMRPAPRPALVAIALLCLLVPFTQDRKYHEPTREAIVTAVLAVVVRLATIGRLRPLEWRPLVFLGTISYSLYLNHSLMGYRVIFHAQRSGLSPSASIALATSVSLILATAITFGFERPLSAAYRRRSRSPRADPPADRK